MKQHPDHLSRRSAVGMSALLGATAISHCSWFHRLAMATPVSVNKTRSVILLWMNGGPATIDLWDLKPQHEHGGPSREIATSVPGLRISEHLPALANQADDLTIIRSMHSREGDHQRAAFLAHTGYVPQAGIDFPTLGSLVAMESPTTAVPNFVSILPSSRINSPGNGFLPTYTAPVQVGEHAESLSDMGVKNLTHPTANEQEWEIRRQVLQGLNQRFANQHANRVVEGLIATQSRGLELMHPSLSRMFDVRLESEQIQKRYGQSLFGQGCLLARRLIEGGVRFVEVTLDGWDTHQDNFVKVGQLAQQLDTAFSALLDDLRERQLLDDTLILCMGEFGRTPRINANTGRDHWPRAWSLALAGGGLGRGGVLGATSPDGTEVAERPVTLPDLIATVATSLGIDPRKQHESNVGRPIRVADPQSQPILELL